MDDKNFGKEAAQEWIDVIEGASSDVRESDLYPHLRKWIAAANPKSVLDIGCGQGVCSEKLDLDGCNYVGVDPSPYLVERAQNLYPSSDRKFLLGNAYALPFSADRFDAAFSIAVWHLLEDKTKAATELSRVLKQGGSFLIAATNPDIYETWAKTYSSFTQNGPRFEGKLPSIGGSESTDVLYFHTYDEILKSLEAANLRVTAKTAFRTVMVLEGKKSF